MHDAADRSERQTTTDAAPSPGDRGSRSLSVAALIFVAAAAVMGWGASFVGLHEYGMLSMAGFTYWSAWLVPATFDGAAFACTLMTYRSSINGRSALRGRILMWAFTGVSSWINWIHQPSQEAQIVAAGLPIAAVAVFDVVLLELRADYEAKHGMRGFRLRPGLLALRWMVDRKSTSEAFRKQVIDIPVEEIAGLGTLAPPGTRRAAALRAAAEQERTAVPEQRTDPSTSDLVAVTAQPGGAEPVNVGAARLDSPSAETTGAAPPDSPDAEPADTEPATTGAARPDTPGAEPGTGRPDEGSAAPGELGATGQGSAAQSSPSAPGSTREPVSGAVETAAAPGPDSAAPAEAGARVPAGTSAAATATTTISAKADSLPDARTTKPKGARTGGKAAQTATSAPAPSGTGADLVSALPGSAESGSVSARFGAAQTGSASTRSGATASESAAARREGPTSTEVESAERAAEDATSTGARSATTEPRSAAGSRPAEPTTGAADAENAAADAEAPRPAGAAATAPEATSTTDAGAPGATSAADEADSTNSRDVARTSEPADAAAATGTSTGATAASSTTAAGSADPTGTADAAEAAGSTGSAANPVSAEDTEGATTVDAPADADQPSSAGSAPDGEPAGQDATSEREPEAVKTASPDENATGSTTAEAPTVTLELPAVDEPRAAGESGESARGSRKAANRSSHGTAKRDSAKTAHTGQGPAKRQESNSRKKSASNSPAQPEPAAPEQSRTTSPKKSTSDTTAAAKRPAGGKGAKATTPAKPADSPTGTADAEDQTTVEPEDVETTLQLPPVPDRPMSDRDKRSAARRDFRLSLEADRPVNGAQLGKRYGLSESWGRRQINAVRKSLAQEKAQADPLVSADKP